MARQFSRLCFFFLFTTLLRYESLGIVVITNPPYLHGILTCNLPIVFPFVLEHSRLSPDGHLIIYTDIEDGQGFVGIDS